METALRNPEFFEYKKVSWLYPKNNRNIVVHISTLRKYQMTTWLFFYT